MFVRMAKTSFQSATLMVNFPFSTSDAGWSVENFPQLANRQLNDEVTGYFPFFFLSNLF